MTAVMTSPRTTVPVWMLIAKAWKNQTDAINKTLTPKSHFSPYTALQIRNYIEKDKTQVSKYLIVLTETVEQTNNTIPILKYQKINPMISCSQSKIPSFTLYCSQKQNFRLKERKSQFPKP